MTFPMLIPTEEMKEQLIATAYPTTIFVDSDGVVTGEPIVGADIAGYRVRMNELIAAAAAEAVEEAEKEAEKKPDPETAGNDEYRVVVLNEDKEPIPDVMVQFCNDTECMMGVTGEDGTADFEADAGTYAVHVLKVPDGYEQDTEEYEAPEDPGNVMITLKQA